jgi:hypothetical protein
MQVSEVILGGPYHCHLGPTPNALEIAKNSFNRTCPIRAWIVEVDHCRSCSNISAHLYVSLGIEVDCG